jgi:hypothetical protein
MVFTRNASTDLLRYIEVTEEQQEITISMNMLPAKLLPRKVDAAVQDEILYKFL